MGLLFYPVVGDHALINCKQLLFTISHTQLHTPSPYSTPYTTPLTTPSGLQASFRGYNKASLRSLEAINCIKPIVLDFGS